MEPLLASPVKGRASGNAGLHAGKPAPDPSRVDTPLGKMVLGRRGLAGSAEARLLVAAAGSSVVSATGGFNILYSVPKAPHALRFNKSDKQQSRHYRLNKDDTIG